MVINRMIGKALAFIAVTSLSFAAGFVVKTCEPCNPCEPVVKVEQVEVTTEVTKPLIAHTQDYADREQALREEIARLKAKAAERVRNTQPAQGCPASCVSLDFGDIDLINQAGKATEKK